MDPFTSKIWIKKIISHHETEKVPFYLNFTPVAKKLVEEYYGRPYEDSIAPPVVDNGFNSCKPIYADPDVFGKIIRDEFGVAWTTNKFDRGIPVGKCLQTPDISDYIFPDFTASYRFEGLEDWCKKYVDRYRIIWAGDLWERATFMRGMAQILEDLILNKTFVYNILEKITDYILGTVEILCNNFDFECIAISDDYGTQKSLMISPSHWCDFIKPCLKKIYGLVIKYKKDIFHHSDGNIYPVIKELIDMGCNILHPVQPETMDIFKIKKEFGKYLTICGGLNTQHLLVNCGPEEIISEIRKLKKKLGHGGGFILGSGLTIQKDVPFKNIIAMIDEMKN
jgi:uroporphyrinogen decarboxylase